MFLCGYEYLFGFRKKKAVLNGQPLSFSIYQVIISSSTSSRAVLLWI